MKTKTFLSTLMISTVLLSPMAAQARDKIVGGERVTDLKEVPFMVSLSGSCGGSIIAPTWVLTAAHCAGYFSEVKGGILNLKEQGVTFKIKRVIKHPQYSSSTMRNDFCLVELAEKIDFKTSGLKAVALATPRFETEGNQDEGMDATIFGFGDIGNRNPNRTKDLNKVIVPIVSNEVANRPEAYDGDVDATMIAAGLAGGGKDSCQGDSGGPMVVYDHRNDPVQVGIVSWGAGCAAPNKYGIYAKVAAGYEWIKKTMAGR